MSIETVDFRTFATPEFMTRFLRPFDGEREISDLNDPLFERCIAAEMVRIGELGILRMARGERASSSSSSYAELSKEFEHLASRIGPSFRVGAIARCACCIHAALARDYHRAIKKAEGYLQTGGMCKERTLWLAIFKEQAEAQKRTFDRLN
jgi:hypothetical protein